MQIPLTTKQRAIYEFIAEEIQRASVAPSLEEIGRRFGLSSLATVHKHAVTLREKGYITWTWGCARTMQIVPPPGHCPTCGQAIKAKDSAAA